MNDHLLTIADVIIEAMPFSDEIVAWCRAHPEFKEALKVTNPDRFFALGMIITTHTKNVPEDLVIGFMAYDMVAEKFKQDFIIDVRERHIDFVLYMRLPDRNYSRYVHDINEFCSKYGQNGDYANSHHVNLDYILSMGNEVLSDRARRTVETSKQIVEAGGRRYVSQQELKSTLAKIRAEKAKE